MLRALLFNAVCLAGLTTALGSASADDAVPAPPAPPTQDELIAAKEAFKLGNALYQAGKFAEAVDKLKESYRLSRNPFLLYNVGLSYDQLGQGDQVLLYYKQFLATAPADAPMRGDVVARIEALEKELAETPPTPPTSGEPDPAVPPPPKLIHDPTSSAPPGLPFDVVATIAEDANVVVTLLYRSSGEAAFTSRPMVRRGTALVGRISRKKMLGNSVQYYMEARDPQGTLVTRSGRSISPHLVNIEATARPRFDPDLPDEDGPVVMPKPGDVVTTSNQVVPGQRDDGGSSGLVLAGAKWTTSGIAVALLGLSIVSYRRAQDQHVGLLDDSRACGEPPCRVFDADFGQTVQARGERYDLTYKVSLGLGAATAVIAGYLWYRSLTSTTTARDVAIAPTADANGAGAVVMGRF